MARKATRKTAVQKGGHLATITIEKEDACPEFQFPRIPIDPANSSVLIDRKLGLGVNRSGGIAMSLKDGQREALRRQAKCMKQNEGMTIVYEVPNKRVAEELRRFASDIFAREGAPGRFTVVEVSP